MDVRLLHHITNLWEASNSGLLTLNYRSTIIVVSLLSFPRHALLCFVFKYSTLIHPFLCSTVQSSLVHELLR
jgi:hypothetical protein